MGFSPQTFIIKRNSALSRWEYELRGSMWPGPLLEHGNTIKEKRKNILVSLCFTSRRYFWSVRWGECTMLGDEPHWRSHLLPWQFQSGGFLFAVKLSRQSESVYLISALVLFIPVSREKQDEAASTLELLIRRWPSFSYSSSNNRRDSRWKAIGGKKEIPPPPQLRPCCRVN